MKNNYDNDTPLWPYLEIALSEVVRLTAESWAGLSEKGEKHETKPLE